jgi:hypothetical protein
MLCLGKHGFPGFLGVAEVAPRLPETSFKVYLGKPNRRDGNLLIYIPKVEKEVFGLRPGDLCEISLKVLKRSKDESET